MKADLFENFRLYLKDSETGLLEIRYICKDCNKEMTHNDVYYWYHPVSTGGVAQYHKTEFKCEECYLKWEQEKE